MQINATTDAYGQPFPMAAAAPAKSLDKDAFLLLFVEQLKNQNPMSPQDSSEFMAQMAQFSMLEQLTNINENILQAGLAQVMGGASALLDKQVTVQTAEGEVTGLVEKVTVAEGDVLLVIDGKGYGLDQVTEFRSGDGDEARAGIDTEGQPDQKEDNDND